MSEHGATRGCNTTGQLPRDSCSFNTQSAYTNILSLYPGRIVFLFDLSALSFCQAEWITTARPLPLNADKYALSYCPFMCYQLQARGKNIRCYHTLHAIMLPFFKNMFKCLRKFVSVQKACVYNL